MGQIVSDVTDIMNNKKARSDASSERKRILEKIADDEKSKNNLIKKNLAIQRAKYGAAGMTNKGLTEEAVLKRLRDETAEPFDEKKKVNMDKFRSIKVKKTNLLKMFIDRLDDNLFG